MLLGSLLKPIGKKFKKIPIKGISFDSRKIKRNDIFFAINGARTSGVKFIKQAVSKGAIAVVANKKIKKINLKYQ